MPRLPLRIMLVDDSLTFVSAIRRVLDLLPDAKVVAQAYDGQDAMAQAEWVRPDLVLLDIAMPGMTGLELARLLCAWRHPPEIIFLSMHASPFFREAAQEFDARCVGKADFVLELLPLIEELIGRRTGW